MLTEIFLGMGNYSQAFFKEVPFWYFLQGNQNLHSTTVQVGDFLFWKTGLRKCSELSKVLVLLINIPLVLLTSVVVVHYHQC
jgi:hypothetical protein